MKILYLNPSAHLGGAERVLLDILAEVRIARPEWELSLISGEDGPLLERARALGVVSKPVQFPARLAEFGDSAMGGPAGTRLRRMEFAGKMFAAGAVSLGYSRELGAAIGAKTPRIIHTNGFKMHLLGARAAPHSARVIWHLHDYLGMRPMVSRLLAMNRGRAALAIANSRSVAEDARLALGKALRIVPIPNGIDLRDFAAEGPCVDLDRLAGAARPEGPVLRVGLIGTMARWKGHEVFLRALSMLAQSKPIRGYVIGGNIYSTRASETEPDELKKLASQYSLNGRVAFTGFVDEPARAIRALDIVVHASTHPEPFGRVIAEAMACGRPVIVSAAGGAAEIVTPNENALTFEPGDAAALAGCIERLASDDGLRSRLGKAGRATALEKFDRARMAGEIISTYEDVARNGE